MTDKNVEQTLEEVAIVNKPLQTDFDNFEVSEGVDFTIRDKLETEGDNHLKELFQKMKEKDPDAKCPTCGGKPFKGTTCNVCGAGRLEVDISQVESLTEIQTSKLLIPKKYVKERFDFSILQTEYPDLQDDKMFAQYGTMLTNILGRINKRQLEKTSLYISAPSGFGKMTFVYTALQMALVRDLTVFPYLDLLEAKRLIDAYETRNFSDPIISEVAYSDADLYKADVVFLKVPHAIDNIGAYKTMLQIIDRRARRDLPTIIMSRYRFNYFIGMDKTRETQGIISYNNPSPKNLQVHELFYRRKDDLK